MLCNVGTPKGQYTRKMENDKNDYYKMYLESIARRT